MRLAMPAIYANLLVVIATAGAKPIAYTPSACRKDRAAATSGIPPLRQDPALFGQRVWFHE